MNKDEVWEKIKEDKSKIYNQNVLDVFLQVTDNLRLSHYLELTEKQKNLIKNPKVAYELAMQTFLYKGAFSKEKVDPRLEKIISQSAGFSHKYAANTESRFELGEPVISQDPSLAFFYARDIIQGRWEMGEPAISRDAYHSLNYAFYVLRDRFKLGEPAILQSGAYVGSYLEQFPEAESEVFKKPWYID